MVKELSAKQSAFVDEYLVDLNATQAAIRAGYSEKTAGAMGGENLQKPEIQQALTEKMRIRSDRVEIKADYVLATIQTTVERCRQAEPVRDKDGKETGEYKFDATNTLKGCELLGRHLGLFKDRVEVSQVKNLGELVDELPEIQRIATEKNTRATD